MVESKLLTLDDVIREQFLFNVPIYQRLYVWGEDQVRVLMEDLQGAFDKKSVFYLGGALVIERPLRGRHRSRRFDLIDGQQRFTTLWLISIVCNILALASEDPLVTNYLKDYRMQKVGGRFWPRISFAIRPKVEQFFERALAGELTPVPEAVNLENAINTIQGYLRDKALNIGNFTHYLRTNVKIVVTEVPAETDLNKLFEIINNRGLQLQHHDILKARLLEKLHADERDRYGRLWDACANMDDYVERNLRNMTGLKLVRLFDSSQARDDGEKLATASSVLSALSHLVRKGERETLSLKDILESDAETDQPRQPQTEGGDELLRVRSIITFPMLLQHVLRIHLLRTNQEDVDRILDKDLLRIFQQSWLRSKPDSDEIREFIELLWEVRYRFDKHIVKWIHNDDGEEIHAIRKLRIIKGDNGLSLVRDKGSDSGSTLLQSMLYHSQQITTQYWLTPLLNFLLEEGPKHAFLYLKHLDNHLLCATDDRGPLVERTRLFLAEPWHSSGQLDATAVLSGKDGTRFPHYWFYKLEFILWDQLKDTKGSAWRTFRMTAKNSIEHISPQQQKSSDSNKISHNWLDAFGNLALVARSINSEYSNKSYAEKRERFREGNRKRVDSLKMALIYENEKWNDALVETHQNEMIECFKKYFRAVEKNVAKLN